jgi:hypothetical protein
VVLLGQVRDDVHARGVEPQEEGLAVLPGLVDERERVSQDLVVHRFHAFRTQLSRVLDLLLPDLAPARLHGGSSTFVANELTMFPRSHRRPERGRVAVLANPANDMYARWSSEAKAAARSLGLQLQILEKQGTFIHGLPNMPEFLVHVPDRASGAERRRL